MTLNADPESAIRPEDYARWRNSRLGSLTESIEQRVIFEFCGNLPGLRVLDLGCGDGTYSIRASEDGAFVTGVDISSSMLRAAHARSVLREQKVKWVQSSVSALPFASNTFDVVIIVTVLCFAIDPDNAIREATRALRPGGSLIIGELGKFSCWAVSRRIRAMFGSKMWRTARFRSVQDLRRLVEGVGLRLVASQPCVYYPPSAFLAEFLSPFDSFLPRFGQFGAAFIAAKAMKQ